MTKTKSTFGLFLLGIALNGYALEYKTSGEFRLRTLNKDYYGSDKDLRNVTQLRARFNLDVAINNQLSFHLTPQATKDFGEVISAANDENSTAVNSSGDKYHSSVDLFEAYIDGTRGDVGYRLGTQQLAYGDNVVLGTRNWVNQGQTFDALKFTVPVGSFKLDLVYSQISEGMNDTTTKDDVNLAFGYLKIAERSDYNFDLYVIHNQKKEISETISYGIRLKKKFGSHALSTEDIAQEFHNGDSSFEHSLNFGYDYTFGDSNLVFIGYAQTTKKYDQLYTNRHAYNGIADIVGRKNLETFNAGYKKKVSDFTFKLEYLFFRQKSLGVGAFNQATSSVLAGDRSQKNIGQEIDLIVDYKMSPSEKIQFGASQFYHGDYFSSKGTTNFFYLEYRMTF